MPVAPLPPSGRRRHDATGSGGDAAVTDVVVDQERVHVAGEREAPAVAHLHRQLCLGGARRAHHQTQTQQCDSLHRCVSLGVRMTANDSQTSGRCLHQQSDSHADATARVARGSFVGQMSDVFTSRKAYQVGRGTVVFPPVVITDATRRTRWRRTGNRNRPSRRSVAMLCLSRRNPRRRRRPDRTPRRPETPRRRPPRVRLHRPPVVAVTPSQCRSGILPAPGATRQEPSGHQQGHPPPPCATP